MKKLIRVIPLILLVLVLVSCGGGGENDLFELTSTVRDAQPIPYLMDTANVTAKIGRVYPDVVTVRDGVPGCIVDTWQEDDPGGVYENKGPIGILITNKDDVDKGYQLFPVFNNPGDYKSGPTPIDGLERAPEELNGWLVISDSLVEVPARSSLFVPVGLVIPSSASVPGKWEFQVQVREAEGSARTGLNQRWVVLMTPDSIWSKTWFRIVLILAAGALVFYVLGFVFRKKPNKETEKTG